MKAIVNIQNLSFTYGKDKILNDVNVNFSEAKLSVVMGKNGSGKSTLFNIIAGLEKKYDGNVFIGNEERKKIKVGSSSLRLGFMTQFHQTTFPFKVFDVVMTGRASFSRFSPKNEDYQIVEEMLTKFNLWHLKDKAYTSLSGGERQLVLLCRVLVQNPDVLMLDEPTNHLDLHYQVLVLETLQELVKQGKTVLCVMHDPNLAFMYGDQFYMMKNHQLVDLENYNQEEIKNILQETYQLPLLNLTHQGKQLFVPQLK
ncbi:ABC transporter ATP-binding protein [Empedobacter falsenii]|uniref:ABC transporter ATP-binding protein n=2 Tax=Empedobacter falsenii TaxID=343874 RepID=UPI002577CFF1|nr:ABC transporter ATP-binding protein [Empedobacter falsenii]MDM1548474.1 ABC transporter ATP-binding protein [Empedobacter falsenii]